MSNKITQLSTYDKVNEQWRQPVDLGAKAKNIDLDIGNGSIRNMQGVIGEYTDDESIAQKIGHLDRTISYADWNLLSEEEKNSGDWYIPDFPVSGSILPMASDFTGATGSIAGIHGLVPAPAAGDENKVLKGDGSWGEAAADDNFVGSTERWGELSLEQRLKYKTADIDNDFNGLPIDSELNSNSTNPIQNKVVADNIGSIDNNIEAIVNVYGSKNLLPNNATTQVINGVTFTVNSDGSVTVSGTASANALFIFYDSTISQYTGKLLSGGISENIVLGIDQYGAPYTTYSSKGNDTLIGEFSNTVGTVWVLVKSGTVITTPVTVYPMIRDARITDPTYVPYAMTNRELTENVIKTIETSVMLSQVTWATVSDESSPMYYVTDLYSLPNARKIISAEITNFARLKTTDFIQPFIYNKALGLMGNTNFSGRSYANIQIQIAYI